MRLLPEYLILSMFLTMVVLYVIHPLPEVIIKYPTPDRQISDLYIDDNGVHYRYHRQKINN